MIFQTGTLDAKKEVSFLSLRSKEPIMRKTPTLLAGAVSAALTFPAIGHAQTAPAAEPASPHTLTANIGLYSSYRFARIDQTFGKPALQGGSITPIRAASIWATGTPM